MPTLSPVAKARRTHAERSQSTRDQLISAAISVVREKSYQGASVFEVAKSAGVTPGALQHHFGSKAVLMMRVVDEILRSSGATGIDWPDARLPLEKRAKRFVQALWARAYEPPRFLVAWNVYFGCSSDPQLRDYIAEQRASLALALRERFLGVFPEAAADPGIGAFVDLVLSSLRGLGLVRLFGPQPEACAAQLDELAGLIVQRCQVAQAPATRPARRVRRAKPPGRPS